MATLTLTEFTLARFTPSCTLVGVSHEFCRGADGLPIHPGPCRGVKASVPKLAPAARSNPGVPHRPRSPTPHPEERIAAKLNDGEELDLTDPAEAKMHASIQAWTGPDKGANARKKRKVIAEAKAAFEGDPNANTAGASLLRAAAAAPPNAPLLYRGLWNVPADKIPKRGQTFDLGLTSFTQKERIGHVYAGFGESPGSVMLRLSPGSRSLDIRKASHEDYQGNQEWLSTGKFRVKSVRKETFPNTPLPGTFTLTVVEIEQVER